MSVHERTYSFRAGDDLAERTRGAFDTWSELLCSEGRENDWDRIHELWLALMKQYVSTSEGAVDNQSARLRRITEIFVAAAESVVESRGYTDEYREWAKEDEEGSRVREGALLAAASRWRDE